MTAQAHIHSVYLRHTDVKGLAHVAEHRVVADDKARFIARKQSDAEKANADFLEDGRKAVAEGKARTAPAGQARVEQITEEVYRAQRFAGRR